MTIMYSFEYYKKQNSNILLVDNSILNPNNLFTWDFDVLQIKDNKILCNIAGVLFESILNIIKFENIEKSLLAKFILEVSINYNDSNPFHNFQHAICVLHVTYMIIISTHIYAIYKRHIIFAILITALVHDIKHPGHTNSFEINSHSELSLLYKNQSVLEHFHCSTSLELLYQTKLLEHSFFTKSEIIEIYKTINGCILGTDLSLHNNLIEIINKKRGLIDFNLIEDQYLFAKLIIHCADLSNQTKKFDISYEWTLKLYQEFKNQILKEESNNIPSVSYMKIDEDIKKMSQYEIKFIESFVKPIWTILCDFYPCLNICIDSLNNNIKNWNYIIEDNDINKLNSG